MNRYIIGSLWDRVNRNGANKNFEYLFEGSKRVDELNKRADSILDNSNSTLNEAKKTNDMNKNVQQQINTLIAESGTSDAELLQVRTDVFGKTFPVAKDRLDQSQKRLYHIDENKNKEVFPKIKERKPMMTFVDDDGMGEVLTKWEPILQEKGNKLTVAVVSSWVESDTSNAMGWDELHRLDEDYGVEIVNHTHEHLHANSISEEQIHNEYRECKRVLEREGFTHDIIVQPFGENTRVARKVSRNYARANIGTREGINYPPQATYTMSRITLGEDTNNTWTHYKSVLDEAIENDGWIIFKSHSQYPSFDNTQIAHIKSIIDYARANGVLEVSLEEGLDLVGNIMDIGDYPLRNDASLPEYTVMDYQGVIHSKSNSRDFMNYSFNEVNIDTPITFFKTNTKSMCTIIGNNAQDFPEAGAGVLETTYGATANHSYQLYHRFRRNSIYKRHWTAAGEWSEFENIATPGGFKEYNFNTWAGQTIVPAGGTASSIKNNNVTVDVELGDYIYGSPQTHLPDGIMYNIIIKADKEVEIRYFNATSESINIPSTFFNFKGEKRE